MAELPIDGDERESVYSLLQRGQALIKSRHHAQAAIVLARAARAEPGKGSILEPLGRAYHHSGQFERARQTFEELLDVDPSAHWAHFALAVTLRKLDRAPAARRRATNSTPAMVFASGSSPRSTIARASSNGSARSSSRSSSSGASPPSCTGWRLVARYRCISSLVKPGAVQNAPR